MCRKIGASMHALLVLAFAFLTPSLLAQDKTPTPVEAPSLDEILKETQKGVTNKGHVGFIWWIPTEFWEAAAIKHGSTPEHAEQTFKPLRRYLVVAVAIGTMGIGNVNWYNEQIIRAGVMVKDLEGTVYSPLTDLSGDAKGLVTIFKPMLSNLLGPMGQNVQLLFFPASSANGKPIADPRHEGGFTIGFIYPEARVESQYEWRLPLTSLSPPKYCPVGKERVKSDWKYCPWHGNKLEAPPALSDEDSVPTHPIEKKVP
jgi:hypothetical protein